MDTAVPIDLNITDNSSDGAVDDGFEDGLSHLGVRYQVASIGLDSMNSPLLSLFCIPLSHNPRHLTCIFS